MKATEQCYHCLGQLVHQAAALATEDSKLGAQAIQQGLRLLELDFSINRTPIAVATLLHRLVRAITGNIDPYRRIKEAEAAIARKVLSNRRFESEISLRDCLALAVQGNTIDFFLDLKGIHDELARPVNFAIDDYRQMETRLEEAKGILYLADNAGEVFFDLPLVRRLQDFAPVTYAVKASPVQDDISLADVARFGLAKELPRVITTGTDTPGVDMALASREFKAEFEAADLVLAKGMACWETLSEMPAQGKVFYLLKAKCQPVAHSLGVAVGSYVLLLR